MLTDQANRYKPFAISVAPHREEVSVAPEGELDIYTVHLLEQQIEELRAVGFRQLVIDLRGLDFMDSCGLHSLVALRDDCRRSGHWLRIVEGRPAVQRLFFLTGTRGLFEWCR